MKLVTYSRAGAPRVGVIVGEKVVDLLEGAQLVHTRRGVPAERAASLCSGVLGRTMVELLEAGDAALAMAREVADAGGSEPGDEDWHPISEPLSGVRLLAPVPRPGQVIGIGGNYPMLKSTWPTNPAQPPIFQKARSCVAGPQDDLILPSRMKYIQPELELVLIIGKRAKNLSLEGAWDAIAGYTIGNDVSAIDSIMGNWVHRKRPDIVEYGLPGEAPYNFGLAFESKSFGTFGLTGPYLATKDEVDATSLQLTLRINDEVIQTGNTRDMLITIPQMLKYITSICTLEPGDLVFTGALNHLPPLRPGDKLDHEIEGLGRFTTHCRLEGPNGASERLAS